MAKQENALAKRVRQWRRTRADERLFKHLAELFKLERRDEDVLIGLADEHKLVRISEVFVRPSLWKKSPDPRSYPDKEMTALRQRVFGGQAQPSSGAAAHPSDETTPRPPSTPSALSEAD